MAKYLSKAGAIHLVNKVKENFVSSNEPVQAAYSTNAGHADTSNSANSANQATNDAAGNPIHSTYLTIKDAANIYLQKNENAVSATNAVTSSNCTGNAENSTRLATPRKIKFSPTIKISVDGNSSTATRATSDSAGNVITNHYAPNYNPVFTGTPQAPTANEGTNNNQLATTAFVQAAIKKLIGTALETLDTLNEIAEAISKDENLAASENKIIYTKNNSYVTADLTEFARTLLDDSDAATARQTLNALGKNENAVSATQLETARQISITDGENIGAATNFDGTENILVGVTGILPIERGGTGNSRGNAASDTKLEIERAISITDGVNTGTASNFDGTENIAIQLPTTIKANLIGNSTSATKLEIERAISITDGVNTGAATNFDGTKNILLELPATIQANLNGNADTSTRATQDSAGNIIIEEYMPKISTAALTIPIDGWLEDEDVPFNRYYDFEISELTADDVVNVTISPNNQGLCVDCGLCPTCENFNGILRFRAKATPTANISAEFYILKGASNGKEKSFGSVNCSTSQRVVIYKVPSQVGTLSFNGKIQTPTWDDYDPTKLLMIGEISGVNADTYTVSFIPIGNCTWSSDTREPRIQTWKINRAVIDEIPSQGELLTYNGEPQTPTLNNFDAEKLTLSGDFENLVVKIFC